MAFIPGTVNVDRKWLSDGKSTHLITCSEDGIINIWDTRLVDKEFLKKSNDLAWKPYLRLEVFKQDGTGELGLSRILLQKN